MTNPDTPKPLSPPSLFSRVRTKYYEHHNKISYAAGAATGIAFTIIVAKHKIRALEDQLDQTTLVAAEAIYFIEAHDLKDKAMDFLAKTTESELMAHVNAQLAASPN